MTRYYRLVLNGVGTNFGSRYERRCPKGPQRGMVFLGRGQPAAPHQLAVCGSAVSSPAVFGADPRPPKGFLVFCAVRLPFPAYQYVLHAVCIARY